MKRIAIVVDNPLRDLPGDVLLSCHLSRPDLVVYLVPFDNAPHEIFRIKPDYVLVNYVRKTNEVFLNRLVQAGLKFGVLDTEGGVFVKMEEEGGRPNFVKTYTENKNILDAIADYFVWGRAVYDYLSAHGPIPKKCLRLTGTPRSDVLSNVWQNDSNPREIILINTSFTLGNPKFRTSTEEAEDLINRFKYQRHLVYEVLDQQKVIIQDFIEVTKELSKRFPKQFFVLRPHPFESHDVYLQSLKGIKNVEIRGDNSIDYWLRRTKALFHYECSTAIEASLMGVPAFSLKKYAASRPIEEIARLTDYCMSSEDLFKKIEAVLEASYQAPSHLEDHRKKIVEDVYFKFDGLSSERISQQILNQILGHSSMPINQVGVMAHAWFLFYKARNMAKLILKKPVVRDAKKIKIDDVMRSLNSFLISDRLKNKKIQAAQDGDSIQILQESVRKSQ